MKRITIAALLALVTVAATNQALAAKKVHCEVWIDRELVSDKILDFEQDENEGEGAGSVEFYHEKGLRFYYLAYPSYIVVQHLSFNDVVERTTMSSSLKVLYYLARYGDRIKMNTTIDDKLYKIKCQELPLSDN